MTKVKVEKRSPYQGVPQYGITGQTEITPDRATAEKWAALENAANAAHSNVTTFADRINPSKLGFSPKMTALVGAIIGHDYGVIDRKGGIISHLSITSDGYLMADSTAHDTGAFLGAASDLERNIALYLRELSPADQAEFQRLYKANVRDWRSL